MSLPEIQQKRYNTMKKNNSFNISNPENDAYNLIKSKYVEDESGIIKITQHGSKTAHVLVKYFPEIINVKYTAEMEKELEKNRKNIKIWI